MATAIIGKTSEITIFLKSGSTLMFYECEILAGYGDSRLGTDHCDILFNYRSKSTGKLKRALFCTMNIAGHSFDIYEGPIDKFAKAIGAGSG